MPTTPTVYEGSVKVRLKDAGGVDKTLRFLNALRAHPYLRVFNMTGEGHDVIITLALRQQMPLEKVLSGIPSVSNVTAHRADETGQSEDELEVALKVDLPPPEVLAAGARASQAI